jgi:hypothetical protein
LETNLIFQFLVLFLKNFLLIFGLCREVFELFFFFDNFVLTKFYDHGKEFREQERWEEATQECCGGRGENKVMSPVVKFVDMRAAAGQRMSIVGARIGGENDSLPSESCTRILHPIHPVRRVAAAEAAKEMKAAATGKP